MGYFVTVWAVEKTERKKMGLGTGVHTYIHHFVIGNNNNVVCVCERRRFVNKDG